MQDNIDKKIKQANEQLKSKGARVTIYRRGGRLNLRGTLPPKPHLNKTKHESQVVSLGRNATASEKGILHFEFLQKCKESSPYLAPFYTRILI